MAKKVSMRLVNKNLSNNRVFKSEMRKKIIKTVYSIEDGLTPSFL